LRELDLRYDEAAPPRAEPNASAAPAVAGGALPPIGEGCRPFRRGCTRVAIVWDEAALAPSLAFGSSLGVALARLAAARSYAFEFVDVFGAPLAALLRPEPPAARAERLRAWLWNFDAVWAVGAWGGAAERFVRTQLPRTIALARRATQASAAPRRASDRI